MTRALAIVVLVAGCGVRGGVPAPAPPPESVASGPPAPWPEPRKCAELGVDWCNRGYDVDHTGEAAVLVGGDWEVHVYACEGTPWAGEHVTFRYRLHAVALGDVDGDGTDDVVVALDEHYYGCGDQGSYWTTHLLAFRVDGGVVTPLGDRTVYRYVDWELSVAGGEIRRTYRNGCIDRWRLTGTELVEVEPRCGG